MPDNRVLDQIASNAYLELDKLYDKYALNAERWSLQIVDLSTAYNMAYKSVQAVLKAKAEREKLTREMAFFALGLVIGSGCDVLKHVIKQRKGMDKYLENATNALKHAQKEKYAIDLPKDVALKVAQKAADGSKSTFSSTDPFQFFLNLRRSNVHEKVQFMAKLQALKEYATAKSGTHAREFPAKYLEKFGSYDAATDAVVKWVRTIERELDKEKLTFLSKPPKPNNLSIEQMSRIIERSMWAKWVSTNTSVRRTTTVNYYGGTFSNRSESEVVEESGTDVENRLIDLRIIRPDFSSNRWHRKRSPGGWRKHFKRFPNENWTPPVENPGWNTNASEVKELKRWASGYLNGTQNTGGAPNSILREPMLVAKGG